MGGNTQKGVQSQAIRVESIRPASLDSQQKSKISFNSEENPRDI